MADLLALIEGMTPDEQAVACRVLDAVSRPLTPRELERMFRDRWVSKSAAVKLATVLKDYHIIALVGPEEQGSEFVQESRGESEYFPALRLRTARVPTR